MNCNHAACKIVEKVPRIGKGIRSYTYQRLEAESNHEILSLMRLLTGLNWTENGLPIVG